MLDVNDAGIWISSLENDLRDPPKTRIPCHKQSLACSGKVRDLQQVHSLNYWLGRLAIDVVMLCGLFVVLGWYAVSVFRRIDPNKPPV